ELDYIARPNWCPGTGCTGGNIQAMHGQWHTNFLGQGKEFVEFHREFIAQSDDFRIYGADTPVGPDVDPDPAAVPVVAKVGALLKFGHLNGNGFNRPAGAAIAFSTPRPATLLFGSPQFCTFTAEGVGDELEAPFHAAGHGSIATHDQVGVNPGDMGFTTSA